MKALTLKKVTMPQINNQMKITYITHPTEKIFQVYIFDIYTLPGDVIIQKVIHHNYFTSYLS